MTPQKIKNVCSYVNSTQWSKELLCWDVTCVPQPTTLDCKNVDTQQAFIMNDETQQRAIQTFPEENVLSWEKIFHE